MPEIYSPSSEHEVADFIKNCNSQEIPIEITGHNSKPIGRLIQCSKSLNLKNLSGIIEYFPEELYIKVKAGTPLALIEAELDKQGNIAYDIVGIKDHGVVAIDTTPWRAFEHIERLEFLGDAILNMVVANYLYFRFPDQNEGFLSKIRTRIVNGKMLGFLSNEIGFARFAIISKQVEDANGRSNYKIMEDIFEAFIGAVYTDFQTEEDEVSLPKNIKISPYSGAGYFIVESWIIYIIENYIDFSELIRIKNNYKDMLVSYMQHYLQDMPQFKELAVNIKDNNRLFTYCVKDRNGTIIATSTGKNKKEAENNSALEALKYYNVNVNEYSSNI